MTWSESSIARAISRQLLNRRCVVLVDRTTWTGHEADVLGVTLDLRLIDIEVKISRADLKADAAKDKWWHRHGWGTYVDGKHVPAPRTARQWPPKVWKHYYALPADIWKPDLMASLGSPQSGVLLLRQRDGVVSVHCERRCTPNKSAERLTPEQVIDIARLANLRMWDAYESRDAWRRAEDTRTTQEVAA